MESIRVLFPWHKCETPNSTHYLHLEKPTPQPCFHKRYPKYLTCVQKASLARWIMIPWFQKKNHLGNKKTTTRWFNSWPFYPLVGGHDSPWKGSRFHHPKKVTSRTARQFVISKNTYFHEQKSSIFFPTFFSALKGATPRFVKWTSRRCIQRCKQHNWP